MTTKVTVEANHWPVEVSAHRPDTGEKIAGQGGRVGVSETRTFYIHSSQDLLVHEVQPGETDEPEPDRAA